jgi:hypothetical protein
MPSCVCVSFLLTWLNSPLCKRGQEMEDVATNNKLNEYLLLLLPSPATYCKFTSPYDKQNRRWADSLWLETAMKWQPPHEFVLVIAKCECDRPVILDLTYVEGLKMSWWRKLNIDSHYTLTRCVHQNITVENFVLADLNQRTVYRIYLFIILEWQFISLLTTLMPS